MGEPIAGEIMPALKGQARRLLPIVATVVLASGALLALAAAVSIVKGVSVALILDDPLAVYDANPLTGAISNLGVTLWSATAGLSFLTASVLRDRGAGRESVAFFFWSGIVTVALLLDDLFEVHDVIGPRWFHLPQPGFYVAYVVITAAYLWRFRQFLLRSDYLLLVLVGVLFGLSIVLDLEDDVLPMQELFEDGAKFVGIALWLVYFGSTAFASLTAAPSRPGSPGASSPI